MKRQDGFTLVELLIVIMILAILAAVTIMSLIRSRSAANESSAIGSMRTITAAQIAYSASCGGGFYAATLPTLGVAPPSSTSSFLAPDLASAAIVQKSGYEFEMTAAAAAIPGQFDCNGTATRTNFYVRGEPMVYGSSGNRSFATSGTNVIWQIYGAAAPAEPFGAPSLPLQ